MATLRAIARHAAPASSDPDRWLVATYRVRSTADAIEGRAQAIALEQSIEAPLDAVTDARVMDEVVGQVEGIEPAGSDAFAVRVRLAVETTGAEAGQLLNVLFGNSSLHEEVELVDVDIPPRLVARFGGPRFGVAGIRALTRAHGRPLTCSALKPQGLASVQLAAIARTLACAGVDVVKDDHGLADQASAPFRERVAVVQRAIDEANRETGHACVYAPSLTGHYGQLVTQVAQAREAGARMFMVQPMVSGVGSLAALALEAGVPILAHPALAGAARIAPPLLLGKLFRLFGADATIFPNAGGRFSYSAATCEAIAGAARAPWHGLAPTLPVPAGGMTVARVTELRERFGADTMLLIGGGLLAARDGLYDRAREFVAAVCGGG
jgi:ribulose-bisphosphate carboxylase large chain